MRWGGWVPAWVVDIAFPVLVVVLVFWGTLGTVRRRGRLLEKARKETLGAEGESEPAESEQAEREPAEKSGEDAEGEGSTSRAE